MTSLEDAALELIASDPWDWVTEHGSGPFPCHVVGIAADGRSYYVQLERPIKIDSEVCAFASVSPRYKEEDISDVTRARVVSVGVSFARTLEHTQLPYDQTRSAYHMMGSIGLQEKPEAS